MIARQLLEDTVMPLGEIAAALGYSEASAFTRAFRRWSGETPKAWRTRHRGDGEQRSSKVPRNEFGLSNDQSRNVDDEANNIGHRMALQPVPAQVAAASVLCGA